VVRRGIGAALAFAAVGTLAGCPDGGTAKGTAVPNAETGAGPLSGTSYDTIIKARDLKPDDVEAALKTFMPSGRLDEYLMIASGGHSGQLFVIGIPSMRLLKTIAVYTPEAWQGYGTGSRHQEELLAGGDYQGKPIRWGDTHHPALSETDGEYDGQFCFISEKANGRMAVVDLRDFETKQIIKTPNVLSDHGGTFVTPNTEWAFVGPQFATPFPSGTYAPLSEYKEKYRGLVTAFKFDRQKGRFDLAKSYQIEVPPYFQDLGDCGKKASDGWFFLNSFNTEMATGGTMEKKPSMEVGASQNDMDFLHLFNWKKAAEVVAAGKTEKIGGMDVIRMKTAVEEGIFFLAPEPKSPHGVDVTPDGERLVVSGKLDPHVTVYSWKKIQEAIAKKDFDGTDSFGVPILKLASIMEAQVELGLGPLHTQFDDKGYCYTSLFLDSAVAKWSLGEPYHKGEAAWKLVDKLPVQYNIGHLSAACGDTTKPEGKYLVALNKWSIDRFANTGPLLPQNLQLVDLSGPKMKVIYDMPFGVGEPHYAQIIPVDKLKGTWQVYPEVGWDPAKMKADVRAAKPGQEKIERKDGKVTVQMTLIRSHFTPDLIEVEEGDRVVINLTNVERARDATHGFALAGYGINLSIEPGEAQTVEFVADRPGVFPWYCSEFCSALHLEMMGYFNVKPKK
jgi:nitrous-oxide reductase